MKAVKSTKPTTLIDAIKSADDKIKADPTKTNGDPDAEELGELLDWEEQNKAKLSRLKALKEKISERVKEANGDPLEDYIVPGTERYDLVYTPCRNESVVFDAKMVHKMVGDEIFYGGVTVPVKLVTDYVSADKRSKVMRTGPTGSRQVKLKRRTEEA